MITSEQTTQWTAGQKIAVGVVVLAQFAAAYVIGTGRWLVHDGVSAIPPIAFSAIVPVSLFLAAYVLVPAFRGFVMAQDLRFLTTMQIWRVVGFAFLPIYAFGLLPGLFAWPAGVGDVAVGIAAFLVVARLNRESDYVRARGFLWFNLAGLADFAIAVGTAALSTGVYPQLVAGGVTSAPLDVWPLNIFPSFFVPLFMIMHLAVLLKLRALRKQAGLPSARLAQTG